MTLELEAYSVDDMPFDVMNQEERKRVRWKVISHSFKGLDDYNCGITIHSIEPIVLRKIYKSITEWEDVNEQK